MTPKKNSEFWANLLLVSVTLVICALTAEGFLRISGKFLKGIEGEGLYEYDPVLGWKTKPNLDTFVVREGRKILFRSNSHGIRGPEISYDKRLGETRVLILGKSFAQALQVRFDEVFSQQLQKRLNEEGQKFEIINTGTAAHSTDQQLLFFRSEGVRYSPDLTVLMFHDNDIWYNNEDFFFKKPKPRFYLDKGKLILTRVPVPQTPPDESRRELRRPVSWSFQSVKEWMAVHSYFYQWIRERVRSNPLLFRIAVRLGLSGKNLSDIPDDFREWKRLRDADVDAAWKITEKLVLEIRSEAEKAGSRFVVFYVPSRPAVVPEHWLATQVRYGLNESDWNVDQVADDLKNWCDAHNVSLIEPTEQFRTIQKQNQARPLYYAMDSHWTPDGHLVAAEVLADWILSHSLKRAA